MGLIFILPYNYTSMISLYISLWSLWILNRVSRFLRTANNSIETKVRWCAIMFSEFNLFDEFVKIELIHEILPFWSEIYRIIMISDQMLSHCKNLKIKFIKLQINSFILIVFLLLLYKYLNNIFPQYYCVCSDIDFHQVRTQSIQNNSYFYFVLYFHNKKQTFFKVHNMFWNNHYF